MLPLPNASGSNNFIRQPNVEDEVERYLVRVDFPLGNDNLFARYICSDRFRYVPGLVRRRPRRHLDVGLGPQLPGLGRAWSSAGPR